jgi:hypothetical protein
MKHLKTINRKAELLEQYLDSQPTGRSQTGEPEAADGDVVALQQVPPQQPPGPHYPLGCSLQFDPGWETDSNGGTAGLCQPVERDLFDCHTGCYWPAQVPDQLNHAPDWTSKCAAAQKDWRKIDLIFP